MSPEQAAGRLDDLGPPADVYSLGATLYVLLTGQSPFPNESAAAILSKVGVGAYSKPRDINPAIPAALQAICLRAMALRPPERYASPHELADDVERFLADEPVSAHAEQASVKARRWLRKHPRTVAAVAATVLVGLTSAVAIAGVVSAKNAQLANSNAALRTANEAERRATQDADLKRREAVAAQNSERLAKLEAVAKRKEAEEARRKAKAVSSYLVKAFRSPDPWRSGRAITVTEILDQAAKELAVLLADDPQSKSSLLLAIGESYFGLGMYAQGLPLLEQARNLRVQLDPDHEDTFHAINTLAGAYGRMGKNNEAVALFREALERRNSSFGATHRETLLAMTYLAGAYVSAGQVNEAVALHEETLRLAKLTLGPEHADTLHFINNLALGYQLTNRWDEALPLFEKVLQVRRSKLGNEHEDTIFSIRNLANAHFGAGKPAVAAPLYEEALKLSKETHGVKSPATLQLMADLVHAYRQSGRLPEAVTMGEEALELRREVFGEDHPNTLASENDLAVVYGASGHSGKALPLYEHALKVKSAKLGRDHPDTEISLHNLALSYDEEGRWADALPLCEELVQLRIARLGREDMQTFNSMVRLARLYLRTDQPTMAVPLYEDLVSAQRDVPNRDDVKFAQILATVSADLLDAQQFAAAERYLRENLAHMEAKFPDEWATFTVKVRLGASLKGQKKYAEAERLLLEGFEGLQAREGNIPAAAKAWIPQAIEALVDLYITWNKPAEAATWKTKLDEWKAGPKTE
jgi:tetratricopeptide (TPR) repeat protein